MKRTIWPILILAALAAACLVSAKEHTLYLDPNGAVEWVVLEKDIRSAEDSPDKRVAEEEGFLTALRKGDYPVARSLRALHPLLVESQLLRETRPFTVRTTAQFDSIESLLIDFFDALDVEHDVRMIREAGGARLTVRLSVRDEAPVAREREAEGDDPAAALIEDVWRIVLTRGVFVEFQGFQPESGDETELADAVLLRWSEIEQLADEQGQVTLVLAWKAD